MPLDMPSTRRLRDELLTLTRTIAAAGANNDSASIDLGERGIASLEACELEISHPALAALTSTSDNLTITVQDSANNSSFAAVTNLATVVTPGVASVGAATKTVKLKLPSTTRRYIRINTAVTASGGNNTASSVTARLLT